MPVADQPAVILRMRVCRCGEDGALRFIADIKILKERGFSLTLNVVIMVVGARGAALVSRDFHLVTTTSRS